MLPPCARGQPRRDREQARSPSDNSTTLLLTAELLPELVSGFPIAMMSNADNHAVPGDEIRILPHIQILVKFGVKRTKGSLAVLFKSSLKPDP